LNALHFKDGFGWAVGGNGLILRTEDGATWVDNQTGKTFPGKFSLSQNYPNPFNPTTNIQFSIPKTEFVTLKIYNLLGQVVVTLVSEILIAGNYSYTWDATGFASGVYYYRLMTDNGYNQSRKLLLLK
jgi:hypothetical protein